MRPSPTFWHRIYKAGILLFVLCSFISAIYVVVGSWLFPNWWYGFFWNNGYKSLRYVKEATFVLMIGHFWLVLGMLIGLIAFIVIILVWRRWVLPRVEKRAALLILGSIVAIFIDMVIVFHIQRGPYARLTSAYNNVRAAMQKAGAAILPPGIKPPFDFYYLDRSGIKALYSQIEPELQEQQRVVKDSGTVEASAGVGVENSRVGVRAGRSTASKSTFAHSEFSPERKCIEIMRYVRTNWPGNYYSTYSDWLATQLFMELKTQYEQLSSLAPGSYGTAATIPDVINPSPIDRQGQPGLEAAKWENALKGQLQLLHGMVFVDGEFRVTKSNAGDVLVENFSERPFRVSFKVFLPPPAFKALPLPAIKTMRLRVFGNVTKPLGEDGMIDVKALAIF